jgi:uncharacterized membrane protein
MQQAAVSTKENVDDRTREKMAIAPLILILVGIVVSIAAIGIGPSLCNVQLHSFSLLFRFGFACLCFIAAIVIASVLTCGCCHVGDTKLKPHTKKRAKSTLVTLCLSAKS